MKIKITLYFFFIFLSFSTLANEDTNKRKEFIKELTQEFKMQHTGTFSVTNQHGNIDILTWNQPKVKVQVQIIVQALDKKRAERVWDRIQIEMKNGEDFVTAITHIPKKKKSNTNWTSWNSLKSVDKFKINYKVYVPHKATLKINNKYGDATISPTLAPVLATISYGNIRTSEMDKTLNLKLSYGDAYIPNAKKILAELNYAKISIKNSNSVELNSRYSKFKIETADTLRISTKYDEFNIGDAQMIRTEGKYGKFQISKVQQLMVEGKYTDYLIGTLKKNADVQLSYGGLEIENVSQNFNKIRLAGDYADFKAATEDNSSYQMDINVFHGTFNLPDNLEKIYEKNSPQVYILEGKKGKNTSGRSIKVSVNYGGVEVR